MAVVRAIVIMIVGAVVLSITTRGHSHFVLHSTEPMPPVNVP
jgi:hypothetical protein